MSKEEERKKSLEEKVIKILERLSEEERKNILEGPSEEERLKKILELLPEKERYDRVVDTLSSPSKAFHKNKSSETLKKLNAGFIYHYTPSESFYSILKDGKFRASSLYHLNDPSEKQFGYETVYEYFKNYSEFKENPKIADALYKDFQKLQNFTKEHSYIVSFSKNSDSLGQWRAYANNAQGFAMGFDTEMFKNPDEKFPLFNIELVYKKKLQVHEMGSINNIMMVDTFSTLLKDPSYKEEEEVRKLLYNSNLTAYEALIINSEDDTYNDFFNKVAIYDKKSFKKHLEAQKKIELKNYRKVIKPQYGAIHNRVYEYVDLTINPKALKKIVLGSENKTHIPHLLKFLHSKGYTHLKESDITRSTIPYRKN